MAYKMSVTSEKELRKAINNFNAKVRRLENVDKEIDIPRKENINAIMERVTNKWDLNREINRLERFTKRNAEELIQNKSGVVMSRWEYENIQAEQKRLSAKLEREIKSYGNIKPSIFGNKQSFNYAQMGDERLSNLKARKTSISRRGIGKANKEEIEALKNIMNKTAAIFRRDRALFFDSYLDGTLLNLSYQTGYDEEKIKYIREKLSTLTSSQFIKAFNSEAGLKDIQDRYIISKEKGVNIEDISQDINLILDELYKNIDQIVEDYK